MLEEFIGVLHSIGIEWKASPVEAMYVGMPPPSIGEELRWRKPAGETFLVPTVDGMALLGGGGHLSGSYGPERAPSGPGVAEVLEALGILPCETYPMACAVDGTGEAATWKPTSSALRTIYSSVGIKDASQNSRGGMAPRGRGL